MDTVVVDGVSYVKASVLAKRFRYTTDYIGQLCRSGKVDAQLVGRSWYVNEAALIAHKEARYVPTRTDEKTIEKRTLEVTEEETAPAVRVHPRLSRITSKLVLRDSGPESTKKNFVSRLDYVPARYETDDADLLPQPVSALKNAEPAPVPVEVAEAKKVRISTVETAREPLVFTDVPEVSLQGALHVENLDLEPESEDLSVVTPADIPRSLPAEVTPPPRQQDHSHRVDERAHRAPVAREAIRFTPETVVYREVPTGRLSSVVSVTVVVLGLALFLLLTLSTHVLIVEGQGLRSIVDFNLAALFSAWSIFN